ncbi:hypothetical protein [Patiriisocius hiemis]|uniref:Uncharacterized protein n=1 Tax=Patiriisocius hiemis TaxID=3075604 RepID=A0ABU2YDZ8_9FLAO|nr:hypothetical protein [Constantimarinum sp. W242]MDT0556418.1 hypothetical protein [Constantimarinum sp. W242]
MAKERQILHKSKIANNCPTCYANNDLEFTFSQEIAENPLFIMPSKEVEETLFCHNCNNTIYPVNWDEDIERVYEYHKKLADPNKASFKLKTLGYILVIGDILLLLYLVYYFAK